jgi:L-iditol 2-dehydrogenase
METRPAPRPGPGEMVLGLRVVGLCGTDLFKLGTGGDPPGTVLGHELVGEVLELGPGTEGFAPGDRVAVPHHVPCGECVYCRHGSETMCETFRENLLEPGGFAERVLVRRRAAALAARKVPDAVTDEAAVFLEPGACVLRGVRRAGLADGDGAAVLGGGSMGLLHLLILRALFPAMPLVLVDPVDERRVLALDLGASAAAAPGGDAEAAIRDATGGAGAGAVFDTVGGARLLDSAIGLTRRGGSVVLFAHAPEGERADFDLNTLFKFERRVIGSYSGALAEQEEIFALMAEGRLDPSPLVTHRLPLDRFEEGVSLSRKKKALKVLYTSGATG